MMVPLLIKLMLSNVIELPNMMRHWHRNVKLTMKGI